MSSAATSSSALAPPLRTPNASAKPLQAVDSSKPAVACSVSDEDEPPSVGFGDLADFGAGDLARFGSRNRAGLVRTPHRSDEEQPETPEALRSSPQVTVSWHMKFEGEETLQVYRHSFVQLAEGVVIIQRETYRADTTELARALNAANGGANKVVNSRIVGEQLQAAERYRRRSFKGPLLGIYVVNLTYGKLKPSEIRSAAQGKAALPHIERTMNYFGATIDETSTANPYFRELLPAVDTDDSKESSASSSSSSSTTTTTGSSKSRMYVGYLYFPARPRGS